MIIEKRRIAAACMASPNVNHVMAPYVNSARKFSLIHAVLMNCLISKRNPNLAHLWSNCNRVNPICIN